MNDFPKCWRRKTITVEVEAKAKEVAVAKLLTELKNKKSDATWFVYLMQCADNSLYTGITNDLPRRLEQHNAGTASRYTRSRLPVELVYHEPQESQSHALKRELAILWKSELNRAENCPTPASWCSVILISIHGSDSHQSLRRD